MKCIISIIIPYYCTPKEYFSRCMASILNLQSDEIEVIIVDDGSSKDFYPVLEAYSECSNVRVIHTKNSGVSAARNRGIDEASGKWILFADSDDYFNTSALEKVLQYAKERSGDIVLFNGGRDYKGKINYNTTFLKENINYAANEKKRISIMESALAVGFIPKGYRQFFSLGAPYCKLLRTEFLRKNNLKFDLDVKFAEDTLFSLEIYVKAKEIYFVDVNLYYYVFFPQSATRRFRPGLSEDMNVFFKYVAAVLKNNHLEGALEKAYYTRAQVEVRRSFKFEFFHPENSNGNSKADFLRFISQEPYYTAIKRNYLPGKGIKGKTKQFLMENGHGKLFNIAKIVIKVFRGL